MPGSLDRGGEECVHHPGHPIFHEGSKGWSCCKKRVLDFDEFMKIEGCTTKQKHMFVGSGKKDKEGEKALHTVRQVHYLSLNSPLKGKSLREVRLADLRL